MTPKKIIQINSLINTGSTGRIAEEIGKMTVNNGFESLVAYGRTNNHSQLKTIRIGSNWDFKMHALQSRILDNHGFASGHATRNFIKCIEQIKPDIIHLHNIHGYYINIKYLFRYLQNAGIPVVWTLHDCWPLTGHCAYFDYVNCNKWQTECYNCPNLRGYPSSFIRDNTRNNFKEKKQLFTSIKNITFVTPSQWLKEVVKQSFFKSYPVKVIYNGVDLSVFKPINDVEIKSKYDINVDCKIILGVASTWDRRKGLVDFIKLNELIGKNEKIVLVGLSKEQINTLPAGIIGICRTENVYELAALYSAADVFVNPTWVDNFPTTNIEALACGTPVVTYRTGGSPEAISDNTGIVINKGDVIGLYNAISKILQLGKKHYEYSCRQRAELLFNKNDRFLDYIMLYKSLL